MSDLPGLIGRLKGRWMAGAGGEPLSSSAPEEWRAVTSGADIQEAELRLLALAGQAEQVAFEPMPPPDLRAVPDLPRLDAIVLSGELRPRFRRLLWGKNGVRPGGGHDGERTYRLLSFLAGRQRAVHPADWFPRAAITRAPALYAPWGAWREALKQAGLAAGQRIAVDEVISAENWDAFLPAERRQAVEALRRADPEKARILLETQSASLPADQRLKLLTVLELGLSEQDAPYLETLKTERSQKIVGYAVSLLARLGQAHHEAGDCERELAEMLETSPEAPAPKVAPKPLKSEAKRRRRRELFEAAAFAGLADALGMTSEALAASWMIGRETRADHTFTALLARTGEEQALAAFVENVSSAGADDIAVIAPLLVERTSLETQAGLARQALTKAGAFGLTLDCCGDALGLFTYEEITGSPAYQAMIQSLPAPATDLEASSSAAVDDAVSTALFTIGLLANCDAANRILEDITVSPEFSMADPRLDMLRLNAALPPQQE